MSDNTQSLSDQTPSLDKPVFFVSLIVLILITVTLLLDPKGSLENLNGIHTFMTHDLGWLFLGFILFGTFWLGWLAFSNYGNTTMGEQGEAPAYSDISWLGMLFCAGIGSNLLYFGTTEWIGYSLKPPPLSGAEPGSALATDWAGAYSFFHWGIAAWSTYAIATLPIAYVLHVKKSTTLRISTSCQAVLGDRITGPLGKLIDILFIFGLVGGVASSLGIGIPMVSAVASDLFGVERGMMLDTVILIGLTALFSLSVSAGLDKGIKLLSDINVALAIILLTFMLTTGPTSFIINQAFDSLGVMFQNFFEMSLYTGAGEDNTFAQDNTIFFWAWWLAWAPFMGLFVARISRGRTIRQIVVGVVGGGSIGCWVGFSILGHSTMYFVDQGNQKMVGLITAAQTSGTGVDTPQFVVELLNAQPAALVVTIVFFLLSFIFVATSLDSAAFTLAAAASENLSPDAQPPRWHRLLWAFVLGGTALSLMYLGGLQVLQAASVIVGLPLLAVVAIMMRSLIKELRQAE